MHEIINPTFKLEIEGYKYLGRGPSSVDGALGWSTRNGIHYRCVNCGSFMQASTIDDFRCKCGAMSLDLGYGRFGSLYGDDNILVYEKY